MVDYEEVMKRLGKREIEPSSPVIERESIEIDRHR